MSTNRNKNHVDPIAKSSVATKTNNLTAVGKRSRLVVMALLVLPSTALACWSLFEIFRPNGLTELEIAQLCLSMLLFLWLTMAFWTAVIGFIFQLFHIDPLSLRRQLRKTDAAAPVRNRHAIVMPVYNEDTKRIMVGFQACVKEIMRSPHADKFDFFMLSDTRDESMIKAELCAWQRMQKRLGSFSDRIFYRRREVNTGRKVGNITDFCQRWGANYESMIVLDADSVMSGERMLDLTRRIEENPDVALIQTIPMPVRQDTFFGRFVQFAAHLYSPMLATGLSFWQTDSANYWGHNAIIRIEPFMQHCGLPTLEGRAPFGGDILSHDFVEAALLRRSGWQCYLLTDTDGSYEEVPSNVVDYAIRDRRWVQGNIQHLGLLGVKGLKTTNRMHFSFGAFAYMSSLVLFVMLMLGTTDALIRATTIPQFFTSDYQLFPTWQIAKQDMMVATLWGTAALLFLPKVLGLLLAMIQRRKEFGGFFSLLFSGIVELFMAVLIAPIMMFYHSYFVLSVFVGHQVNWDAQEREGRMVPWGVAFSHTQIMSIIAVAWGVTTWYYTPTLFLWLLPVLTGMVLAAPVIRLTSSTTLGKASRKIGIFVIHEEVRECHALKRVRAGMKHYISPNYDPKIPALPAENWQKMHEQQLHKKPLPMRAAIRSVNS
ncbi:glucans biosynthesis glucosyltransferase MdoH [Alteromonas pelagimontana]|uniref:Glucans biosynthesis glucosyltransferase H n=1 Tax=Alteromonas pelagimontana TaxID=1858656 RepID=A0A6M4MCM6_9ALTE|nr:glucans biosynthesis glucosyltransferase MdoH [Alteromonas pelagimontana]QJR80829.1 glucans biosynthesis glucosyltransferase MdoH [Alteromonas pelagimontana]